MPNMDDIVCVYSTGDETEFLLCQAALEQAGISSIRRGGDPPYGLDGGMYVTPPGILSLCVMAADLERARPVVQSFQQESADPLRVYAEPTIGVQPFTPMNRSWYFYAGRAIQLLFALILAALVIYAISGALTPLFSGR